METDESEVAGPEVAGPEVAESEVADFGVAGSWVAGSEAVELEAAGFGFVEVVVAEFGAEFAASVIEKPVAEERVLVRFVAGAG